MRDRPPAQAFALLAAAGLVGPFDCDGASGGGAKPASSANAAGAKNCCRGKNNCKGLGGCKTDKNECAGKNACKGLGGCSMRSCP